MDAAMQQGFEDARHDFETMLSCPQCRAEKWIDATPPGSTPNSYARGWILLALDVKSRPHECGKPQDREDDT